MSFTENKKIMVYVESKENKAVQAGLEVLTPAKELANEVIVVTNSEEAAKQVAIMGVQKVFVIEDTFEIEREAKKLAQLIKEENPSLLFMGATSIGKDLAAEVAAKVKGACITDAIGVKEENGTIVYTCPVYGGTVLNDVTSNANIQVISIRSGIFKKPEGNKEQVEIVKVPVEVHNLKTVVKETVKEIAEAVNLEEADVIVAGGRGLGNEENFKLVEELAEVCGGVVGATRPAIEANWISRAHQVGQSGKIVAPKLYIALGISGATQHVSGMIGSGYVIAVNKDEDAPIFDVADVGIVGDVVKVIPLLIEEFKKRKEN